MANINTKMLYTAIIAAVGYKVFAVLEITLMALLLASFSSSKMALVLTDSILRFVVCLLVVFLTTRYFEKKTKSVLLFPLFFIGVLIIVQLLVHLLSIVAGWTKSFDIGTLLMEVELIAAGLVYIWFWLGKGHKLESTKARK